MAPNYTEKHAVYREARRTLEEVGEVKEVISLARGEQQLTPGNTTSQDDKRTTSLGASDPAP